MAGGATGAGADGAFGPPMWARRRGGPLGVTRTSRGRPGPRTSTLRGARAVGRRVERCDTPRPPPPSGRHPRWPAGRVSRRVAGDSPTGTAPHVPPVDSPRRHSPIAPGGRPAPPPRAHPRSGRGPAAGSAAAPAA